MLDALAEERQQRPRIVLVCSSFPDRERHRVEFRRRKVALRLSICHYSAPIGDRMVATEKRGAVSALIGRPAYPCRFEKTMRRGAA